MVGAGLAEFAEEVVGAPEEDRVPRPRRRRAKRLDEEGLADTDRSDEEDMFLLLEEVQREEFVEVAASSELLGACQGEAVRQGRDGLSELEPFEEVTRSASRLMPSPPG